MIEVFAQGVVTEIRFAKGILTIVVNVGCREAPQYLACRVTGSLVTQARRRIKPGQPLTVQGEPCTSISEILANSLMS